LHFALILGTIVVAASLIYGRKEHLLGLRAYFHGRTRENAATYPIRPDSGRKMILFHLLIKSAQIRELSREKSATVIQVVLRGLKFEPDAACPVVALAQFED